MKGFKQISSAMLSSLILLIIFSVNISALAVDTKNSPHILSEGVPGDVVAYATNCYVEHLQVAVHNPDSFDLPVNDLSLYMLGHPFKQYMDDTSYSTYYFPVIYSGTVVGILTVTDMGSRITSSYSKAFAEALNEFFRSQTGDFIITQMQGDLFALSDNHSFLLCEGPENSSCALASNSTCAFDTITESVDFKNHLSATNMTASLPTPVVIRSDPGAPLEHRSLAVKPILQLDNSWCWAACCAMVINYKQDLSLTSRDIVDYVRGGEYEGGASWPEMKLAYNHWGLDPGELPALDYTDVKDRIKADDPIHMGLFTSDGETGHSMVLKGYERYTDAKYYVAIDPYIGSGVSLRVESNPEDISYNCAGFLLYWKYARCYF